MKKHQFVTPSVFKPVLIRFALLSIVCLVFRDVHFTTHVFLLIDLWVRSSINDTIRMSKLNQKLSMDFCGNMPLNSLNRSETVITKLRRFLKVFESSLHKYIHVRTVIANQNIQEAHLQHHANKHVCVLIPDLI